MDEILNYLENVVTLIEREYERLTEDQEKQESVQFSSQIEQVKSEITAELKDKYDELKTLIQQEFDNIPHTLATVIKKSAQNTDTKDKADSADFATKDELQAMQTAIMTELRKISGSDTSEEEDNGSSGFATKADLQEVRNSIMAELEKISRSVRINNARYDRQSENNPPSYPPETSSRSLPMPQVKFKSSAESTPSIDQALEENFSPQNPDTDGIFSTNNNTTKRC